jgi:hypothetical protein
MLRYSQPSVISTCSIFNHSLAHTKHPVNLLDSQPVQNVRHESLESHVFDTSNVLGPLEVVGRAISSSFTGVVDQILGDLSQSSSFLSEVDDNTAATVLCFFDSFLDTEDQVRAAGADIRSEYIATVALVAGKLTWTCHSI